MVDSSNIEYGDLKFTISSLPFMCLIIYCTKNYQFIQWNFFKPIKPLLILYGLFLATIPFQTNQLSAISFNYWRLGAFQTIPFAFMLCVETYKKNKFANFYKFFLIIFSSITVLYGVFLLFMPRGFNPYLIIMQFNGILDYSENYADDSTRAMGRIFSTWIHPVPYNMYIGTFFLCVISMISKSNKTNKIILTGISVITLFAIFTSGARTAMVCIIPIIIYLVFKYINLKYIIIGSFIIFIIVSTGRVTIKTNTNFYDYVISLIDTKKSTTKGSDINMRIIQMEGSIEATKNIIVGNGIGWTSEYGKLYGNHPKAITFESFIFQVLVNQGLLGFIYYIIFTLMLFKLINKVVINGKNFLYLIIVFFYVYTIITGLYACFHIFIILFYSTFIILADQRKLYLYINEK